MLIIPGIVDETYQPEITPTFWTEVDTDRHTSYHHYTYFTTDYDARSGVPRQVRHRPHFVLFVTKQERRFGRGSSAYNGTYYVVYVYEGTTRGWSHFLERGSTNYETAMMRALLALTEIMNERSGHDA